MSRRLQPEFRSATPAPTANSQSREVALASLIARIRAAWLEPASPMRDQQLSRALIDFCVDNPLPAALGHADPDDYRRVELERDMRQGWRLLAMVWGPGQRSSLHSHGGRPAHEAIWRGALTVEHFESMPLTEERLLLCLLARDILQASDAQVSPRLHEDIRRCSNDGDEVCISLHLLPQESPSQRDFELCSDGANRVIDAAPEHHEALHV